MTKHGIPALTSRSRVVASRDQLSAKLSGEAVILGLADSVYYGLDGAGARIWELAQQPVTLAAIADVLTREFDVEHALAMRDLMTLAETLHQRGLLDLVPDTDP